MRYLTVKKGGTKIMRLCLDCVYYESRVYDDYVPQIDDYELFTDHYCKANGCRKLDLEEMEEIAECKDYNKE